MRIVHRMEKKIRKKRWLLQMVVKPRKPKRVVALKGRPPFTLKVHVNSNLYASEWLQDLPYMWSYTHKILDKRNYMKEGFLLCHDWEHYHTRNIGNHFLTIFYQQTGQTRIRYKRFRRFLCKRQNQKATRWSTLMYSLMRLIYLLKERSYTFLLYYMYFQDYRPCSSRKDFPQKRKLGWYLAIFMENAHILHWNYGKQCWN